MTAQIADAIDKALKPRGVAVMIEAVHQCMSMRGVSQPDVAHHHHPVHRRLQGGSGASSATLLMMLATERGRG